MFYNIQDQTNFKEVRLVNSTHELKTALWYFGFISSDGNSDDDGFEIKPKYCGFQLVFQVYQMYSSGICFIVVVD